MTSLKTLTPVGVNQHLIRINQLLDSPVFDPNRREDGAWELAFSEVIMVLDDLLQHCEHSGKRIDFYEEVGVRGKIQDISSLVAWMRPCLPDHSAVSRLSRYYDSGVGYFANGSFFDCDYDHELAFYIDDQRIYLNRHIKRALHEVEQYMTLVNQSPSDPSNLR